MTIPKAVREWYAKIGTKGNQSPARVRKLSPEQASAMGKASAAARAARSGPGARKGKAQASRKGGSK